MLSHFISRGLSLVSMLPYFSSVSVRYGSMEPVIHSGDTLLCEHLPGLEQRVQRGDIVLARRPYDFGDNRPIVKRLIHVPGDEVLEFGVSRRLRDHEYWVLGEQQPLSEDSLDFGAVDGIRKRVLGVYCPHEKQVKMDLGKKAD